MNSDISVPGLVRDWTFEPGAIPRWQYRQSFAALLRKTHRRPSSQEIRRILPRDRWIVFFIYAPDGQLSASHRFTLERLRDTGIPICAICAAPSPDRVPQALGAHCDALYWKDLPGYDFSGYTLALREISRFSPGADVFVMNDSVFGPFSDIRESMAKASWDLTGFTASNQLTTHIQSYAFILKKVDPARMRALSSVLFPYFSLSAANAVILLQEARLARVAARHMQVGAFWYGDCREVIDPTLARPIELLNAGFPFLKRSLLGKHEAFIESGVVHSTLERLGHPAEHSP